VAGSIFIIRQSDVSYLIGIIVNISILFKIKIAELRVLAGTGRMSLACLPNAS
jgi:hypothetical protein